MPDSFNIPDIEFTAPDDVDLYLDRADKASADLNLTMKVCEHKMAAYVVKEYAQTARVWELSDVAFKKAGDIGGDLTDCFAVWRLLEPFPHSLRHILCKPALFALLALTIGIAAAIPLCRAKRANKKWLDDEAQVYSLYFERLQDDYEWEDDSHAVHYLPHKKLGYSLWKLPLIYWLWQTAEKMMFRVPIFTNCGVLRLHSVDCQQHSRVA